MTFIEAFAIVGIGYSLFHALPKIVRGLTLPHTTPVAYDQHDAAGNLAAKGLAVLTRTPPRAARRSGLNCPAARSVPSRSGGTFFMDSVMWMWPK